MKIIAVLITSLLMSSCLGSNTTKTNNSKEIDLTKSNSARIKTIHGDIIFSFYPKEAPNTTDRIKHLIAKGFYNGLTFHRVVPGFVIQGGDPKGNGTGGSGKKLKAEFNKHKHVPGTVAMARSSDPNSADSQFYISMGTHPHLDNSYTVFGFVKKGMDIVSKVKPGDKMISVTLE